MRYPFVGESIIGADFRAVGESATARCFFQIHRMKREKICNPVLSIYRTTLFEFTSVIARPTGEGIKAFVMYIVIKKASAG